VAVQNRPAIIEELFRILAQAFEQVQKLRDPKGKAAATYIGALFAVLAFARDVIADGLGGGSRRPRLR
jgi:hypothetical protein